MDRKFASTIVVLATAMVVNQRAAVSEYGAAARPAATAQEAPQKPVSAAGISTGGCPEGVNCAVLVPYRDTGPWVASCARAGARPASPPDRAELVQLNGHDPDSLSGDPRSWCLSEEDRKQLQYLIVLVPDPVATHLGLYFDRTIEAVEAAAQQREYFLSRYWLPWPLPGETNAPGDTSENLRVNAILNAYKSAQPGLLIFDKSCPRANGESRLCATYAFLVSESPTSGINLSQFRNATRYAHTLSGTTERTPVHVVGPFFSGSVPSAFALAKELSGDPGRSVVTLDFASGTMSSGKQAKVLSDLLAGLHIDFRQTLHDDSRAQFFLLDFLRRRHLTRNGGNVAILQEDETRFGHSLWRSGEDTPEDADTGTSPGAGTHVASSAHGAGAAHAGRSRDADPCSGAVSNPDPQDEYFCRVRYIKFPRELSRLRNATSDDFGATPVVAGSSVNLPADGISWNWKDASKGEDSVPAFSGQQSPLSQQAVLRSIGDMIRQQNIKYVGIAATDIFDILFLSKFLKLAAPNTRVFVLDSDVLMVGTSSEGRELDGTLAVTTYPLFARNGDWTGKYVPGDGNTEGPGYQRSVDMFPSRTIEGIYNAALLALDRDGHPSLREYVDPLSRARPEDNNRPPLWLTAVGRNGFWPVSLISSADLEAKNVAALSRHRPPLFETQRISAGPPAEIAADPGKRLKFDSPDGTTLLLEGALLVWGAIHLIGLCLANKTGSAWLRPFRIRSPHNPWPQAQNQLHYLLSGTLALSAMLLLTAITYASLRSYGQIAFSHPSLFRSMFPALYVSIGLAGTALLAVAIVITSRIRRTPLRIIIAAFSWGTYAAVLAVWSVLCLSGPDPVFFSERAFYLSNGVSPLLPVMLLLMMYHAWAACFIRKVRLSESKHVEVPDPALLGAGGQGVRKSLEELQTAVEGVAFSPTLVPWIIAGFITLVLLLQPWEALASIEGRAYNNLIFGLVAFICFLILLAWARYLFIWSRLRSVLRALERTPLRRAFSRLSDTYSWSRLWYEDAERRGYMISARSVDCFQALVNRGAAALAPRFDRMKRHFGVVINSEMGLQTDSGRARAVWKLQRSFRRAAESLLQGGLTTLWDRDGVSDSLAVESQDRTDRPPLDSAAECRLLAEEFIALRYVSLIHYGSAQLKNLVVLLVVGFILALAAIGSYPFIAGRQCVWSLGGLFLVFGAAIIVSFAQMDRDAIMSRLSQTDPGRLDLSFYLRVVSYGGLPVLALLASQFPSVGRSLFSWLEPALNALH